jgi:hypothetical protein
VYITIANKQSLSIIDSKINIEMTEGILALASACFLIIDAALFMAAWVYSRFVFSRYLKKHHGKKWEQLVSKYNFRGLVHLFWFDITPEMNDFREKNTDDLGDPRVAKIRRISIMLFRASIFGWLAFLVGFSVVAGLSVLLK